MDELKLILESVERMGKLGVITFSVFIGKELLSTAMVCGTFIIVSKSVFGLIRKGWTKDD